MYTLIIEQTEIEDITEGQERLQWRCPNTLSDRVPKAYYSRAKIGGDPIVCSNR